MNIQNKKPRIIVIAGKARSGKNTIADIISKLYKKENKKVIISPYTKYLKLYIKDITGKYDDLNKPRTMLQQLGIEIIKEKLKKDTLLISRQLDDIDIYSYYFDIIIIPDVRFPSEIEVLKKKYKNVTTIKVITSRENFLNSEEKQHITETSLDSYNNFDYIINNDDINELEIELKNIFNNKDYF